MRCLPLAKRCCTQISLAARLVWWKYSLGFDPALARLARAAEWQSLRLQTRALVVTEAREFHASVRLLPIAGAVAATLFWLMLLASSNRALGPALNPHDDIQASGDMRMTVQCVALEPNDLAVVADCITNPPLD